MTGLAQLLLCVYVIINLGIFPIAQGSVVELLLELQVFGLLLHLQPSYHK